MSSAPLFFNHMFEDFTGHTMSPLDIKRSMEVLQELIGPICESFQQMPSTSGCSRSGSETSAKESSVSSHSNDKKEFKVNLDVQQFKPEELRITVDEDFIIVEGKHDERSDEQGSISRQFTRKYKISDDVNKAALTSKLSADGVLTLQAPKMIKEEEKKVFEVPITYANQPTIILQNNQPTQSQENSNETK